jgi:hypothetical protein
MRDSTNREKPRREMARLAVVPALRWSASRDGGVALLLAVALALLVWRAGLEQSLWCDEIFSLMLINQTPAALIEHTAVDNHPPLYYLMLKAWVKLGRLAGLDPGVAWARLPGALAWLALAGTAWGVGRRLLGAVGGAMLAVAMAMGGQLAWAQDNLRGYATATPALAVCFLLMAWAGQVRRERRSGRWWAALWGVYGALAAVALWSHLLSSFVLFLLGVWWIGLAATRMRRFGWRAWRDPLIWGGAAAQGLAALCFVPWVMELRNQVSSLQGPRRDWMTPLTLAEFIRVFVVWYPWGVEGGRLPGGEPGAVQTTLGALSALAPTGAALWAWRRGRPSSGDAPALALGLAGMLTAIANVAMLWAVDRAGWQYVFHGSRYTLFTEAMWGAGLAGLALWAAARLRWRSWTAEALLAPWIICGLAGHVLQGAVDVSGGLAAAMRTSESNLPPPGSPLYVMPSELIPYFRKTLKDYDARRIEALAEAPDGAKGLRVLRLSLWPQIVRERDQVVLAMIGGRKLADRVTVSEFPANHLSWDYYVSMALDGFHAAAAHELAREGFRVRPLRPIPGALQMLSAPRLKISDGWNVLEVGADLEAWRWSSSERARVRLAGPLGPGRFTIAVQGLRQPYPHPIETLWVQMEGERQRVALRLAAGWFDTRIKLQLTRRHERPVLLLEHPIFRMMDVDRRSRDARAVGFLLHGVAILPGEPFAGERH